MTSSYHANSMSFHLAVTSGFRERSNSSCSSRQRLTSMTASLSRSSMRTAENAVHISNLALISRQLRNLRNLVVIRQL